MSRTKLPTFRGHAWHVLAELSGRTPEEILEASVNVLRPGYWWPTTDLDVPGGTVGSGLTIAEYERLLDAMQADLDDMKTSAAESGFPK